MIDVIFLFVFGLFIGSFLNVLIDRLPRDEQIFRGRSYCELCKHKLSFSDLVPVLSFVYLKGKCRYCHTPLSYYYPLVEITTGLLFVLSFVFFKQFLIVYYLFLISSLIVIFFTDLKYGIIPDKILFPAIIATVIFNFQFSIFNYLISAIGSFLFFFCLWAVTRGKGMGFGDVKYVILMGLILGFPHILVGLYIAFLTGAVVSLILVLWGKKKLKGSTIPFGPFLVFGTIVALFWGERLIETVLPWLSF
ncbi:MAG: prepilin peptidase [Candidatus Levybacteria bacterium]|nr:prepilin peptidase [Candidatus Levybacteria bacterium]